MTFDLKFWLHLLIPISIVLNPLLPSHILIYTLPYPLIYYPIWMYFDGCPITEKGSEGFILDLLREYVNKDISFRQSEAFINFVITLTIVIGSYKLLYSRDQGPRLC